MLSQIDKEIIVAAKDLARLKIFGNADLQRKRNALRDYNSASASSFLTFNDVTNYYGEIAGGAAETAIADIIATDGMVSDDAISSIMYTFGQQTDAFVSSAAVDYLNGQYRLAGIGVKAFAAKMPLDVLDIMANYLKSMTDEEKLSTVREQLVGHSKRRAAENLKENGQNAKNLGVLVRVSRSARAKCCDWCSEREGEFEYGSEPDGFWAHHDNCRCELGQTYRKRR